MGLMSMAKKAVAAAIGRKPVPIPREQVQEYIEVCRKVIAHLAGNGTLYPLEMDFVLAVTEHCSNCVFWHNAIVLEDGELEYGCIKLIDKFWRNWDKSFGTVAVKREIKEEAALEWQQQLYLLRVFAEIAHFHGVVDQRGAPPTDTSEVYCREALAMDLHRQLEKILKQEEIADITLPPPPKAA